MRVVLIIPTFNRAAVLADTLQGVAKQSRPPDAVVVVDNASSDGTVAMLARDFPEIEVLQSGDNIGHGAGLALGMRRMAGRGFDAYWLIDDDSRPKPEALQALLEAANSAPQAAALALRGGSLALGWVRHYRRPDQVARCRELGPGVFATDFFLVDGTLIKQVAVDAVGFPRDDYFLMFDDIEYAYRIRQANLEIGVLPKDLMERATLGGKGDESGKPPWRAYYKARNHVRMAIDSRSPVILAGCVVRQIRLVVRFSLSKKNGTARARMLLAGVRDGILGRMGRTVEPA